MSESSEEGLEAQKERILDHACCPRCGDEELKIKKRIRRGNTVVAFKVLHKERDGCSHIEWTIYDPEVYDGDVNELSSHQEDSGGGLSICKTCLSHTQTRTKETEDGWEVVEPSRDEAGQVICRLCEERRGYVGSPP